ncbi:MAG: vitamin B12-dependent ribonucleotide reductase [Kiritimatiellae bacterium]|nr:vitamin B12-dependent ribonucleotide reductase [Kiritimatiellia bacterium]
MLDVTGNERVEAPVKPTARTTKGRARTRTTSESGRPTQPRKLKITRRLSKQGVSPFDQIEWERRLASIGDDKGNTIFSQADVEVPKSWSMLATNVVSSKYFYGAQDTDEREYSVRQLIHRVARSLADWGLEDGYFAGEEDAEAFYDEMTYLCVNQYGAFNSPVWFNVGLHHVYGYGSDSHSSYTWDDKAEAIVPVQDTYVSPQASACFIQAVDDTMEDIMRLASAEAMLFKYGSGTGTDLSTLRSSREKLSGGGTPSGPLSFMRVFDQVAAVIKSGGKTRRAAKMQSLKVGHPDIREFVRCKTNEERKAWALIEQGYDGSFGGEAYESVMYQNANLSVRVTDEFMEAAEKEGDWTTTAVVSGEPVDTFPARELLRNVAEGTHVCGDPGVQYDSTINRWHTCKNSGPINASNPCSEYMFLDNSACNLASVNLMKFVDKKGKFDIKTFEHVVRLFITAQEIFVDRASYPTELIASNSHLYRPLGLGYANLGALIMRMGYPYDSDEGRAYAGAITSLMTGTAYLTSQELAKAKGTFTGYAENKSPMIEVMKMHRDAVQGIDAELAPPNMVAAAGKAWDTVVDRAGRDGFRNAQVTVLAPTGTIGFMMDCDTTGVEPDIALIKYKQLAGGGMMKIVNKSLSLALDRLGYNAAQVENIVKYVDEHETIEGAPGLLPEHLEVFDCAFRPKNGTRFISYKAHLRMMAAVQPFLSGAISKTVNVPTETSVNEIMQTYIEGWKMGLKAVAIYRDSSKRIQPLSTSKSGSGPVVTDDSDDRIKAAMRKPFRRRMPPTRQSITHKFEVAGHEGYLTVGMYEDSSPGELFITMAKEGSTVGGTMDAFGTAISLCLQYGVPVQELCQKFAHSRFEPSGFTKNPDIPIAKSIVDYIFRWLSVTFPNGHATSVSRPIEQEAPGATAEPESKVDLRNDRIDKQFEGVVAEDAPACDNCGSITVRNGACYRCYNCGNSMGCS